VATLIYSIATPPFASGAPLATGEYPAVAFVAGVKLCRRQVCSCRLTIGATRLASDTERGNQNFPSEFSYLVAALWLRGRSAPGLSVFRLLELAVRVGAIGNLPLSIANTVS
jgi:hypothetical protein